MNAENFFLIFRADAYENKMHEQKAELDNLMEERQKLLLIQEQLQKLYEQLPGVRI